MSTSEDLVKLYQAINHPENQDVKLNTLLPGLNKLILGMMKQDMPVAARGATMSQTPVQEGFSSLLRDIFDLISRADEFDDEDSVDWVLELARMAANAMKVTI